MSSFVSSFQQLHVTEIERTPEILADLNGLTMDKKDMLSKTYKYPVEQFQKFELRSRQNRCIDCYGRFLTFIYLHFGLGHRTKHPS